MWRSPGVFRSGIHALAGKGRSLELEHLWAPPGCIRADVGREAEPGATTLEIETDPNAEGFYRRMGARLIGERIYEIDGKRHALPAVGVPARPSA